jgi:hypothetical protein
VKKQTCWPSAEQIPASTEEISQLGMLPSQDITTRNIDPHCPSPRFGSPRTALKLKRKNRLGLQTPDRLSSGSKVVLPGKMKITARYQSPIVFAKKNTA